jgi:hypothetical protein
MTKQKEALEWFNERRTNGYIKWATILSEEEEKCLVIDAVMPDHVFQTIREALTEQKQEVTPTARQEAPSVKILIDALKFYAKKEHWMSQTENGERRLLCAFGKSLFPDGWAEAHGALQSYAVATDYTLINEMIEKGRIIREETWRRSRSAALTTEKHNADEDVYTEGVCGDGAAILKNGQRMTISDVLDVLNATDPDTVTIKRSELTLVMLALDIAAENASDLALHLHSDQWDEALKILKTALEKK